MQLVKAKEAALEDVAEIVVVPDNGSSLGHMPDGGWAFDGDVTKVFSDMLERSIPAYHTMRELVFKLGNRFLSNNATLLDLGCSNGLMLERFVASRKAGCRYIGVDVSEPMLASARARFSSITAPVEIQYCDLRTDFPVAHPNLILSILTLQFTPIEYRQTILSKVHRHLLPGGAFILVEKLLGNSSELDTLMVSEYYDMKRGNGYTQEEIDRKRLSLEGVLVPVTANWNEAMLRQAGFTTVDCFWRWCNFAGWVAIK